MPEVAGVACGGTGAALPPLGSAGGGATGEGETLSFSHAPREPWLGHARNVLALLLVGTALAGLVWFFERPGGLVTSQAVSLSASPTGAAPEVNHDAPDFEVLGLDGETHRLSDFRGRPVWINFWATWCPPCRAEAPDIQAVYDAFKGEGLVVLAVDLGEDASTVRGYATRAGLDYIVGLDTSTEVSAEYRIAGLPAHFFVDRDGVIRDWRMGSMSKETMTKKVEAITNPAHLSAGGK
jgi:peroxiredoxin